MLSLLCRAARRSSCDVHVARARAFSCHSHLAPTRRRRSDSPASNFESAPTNFGGSEKKALSTRTPPPPFARRSLARSVVVELDDHIDDADAHKKRQPRDRRSFPHVQNSNRRSRAPLDRRRGGGGGRRMRAPKFCSKILSVMSSSD